MLAQITFMYQKPKNLSNIYMIKIENKIKQSY